MFTEPCHQVLAKLVCVLTSQVKCYGEALCEAPAREMSNVLHLRQLEHFARLASVPSLMLGRRSISLTMFCIIFW